MQTQTHDIKHAALNKALVYLKSAGCDFAIIYNGQKYGELELAMPKPARAPRIDYMGMYNYMPHLRSLKPGDSVKIPVRQEHRQGLQSTICSAMSKIYGGGTYMTAVNDNHVEVLRLVTEPVAA